MYCGQCGSQFADHHRFCTTCGHSTDIPEVPSTAASTRERVAADADILSIQEPRGYLPRVTEATGSREDGGVTGLNGLPKAGLAMEPFPRTETEREAERAIAKDEGSDDSNPLDPAVLAFDDGCFDEALTLLQRVGSVAEASDDELQLTQTLEVLDQMIQHLDDQERQPFEALAESTERRILRMRDAALPPRLAEAWRAFEAVDFDWALELLRAEIRESSSDRESVKRVLAIADEMSDLLESGDSEPYQLFVAEQRRRHDFLSVEADSPALQPPRGETTAQVDVFRYHDLTKRLAVFSTDGGELLRGDPEDLQISDAEPQYDRGEEELARLGGAVHLGGPRSTPGVDSGASFGLVAQAAAMLILTSKRIIVMFEGRGATQLGVMNGSEVHTFVLPWDLVDSISMPARKSLTDRIAGARTIEIHAYLIPALLTFNPAVRELEDGQTGKLSDEEAMALIASTAATHRLSVSPPSEHARLRRVLNGSFATADGELVANITEEDTTDVPAHLVGRLVERV